jgi:transposase
VFLDETWASTNMTPTRGRSPKGTRCPGRTPHGHWHTTTFLCALRNDGLVATVVLDGPINGKAFSAWVDQMLVPELRPGDIVVMDNLGSHKVAGIREVIEAAGAQLRYLPLIAPTSTRLNKSLASSRPPSEKRPLILWKPFGRPSVAYLINFNPLNSNGI